jgi:AraC-like DNA-binding protein
MLENEAKAYIELSLHECGREICIPDKVFHFTPKDYHLFHYVTAGKGTFEIDGETYHLHRGMIFYIPPHVEPHYSPDPDDPWAYEWLGFSGSSASGFLALAGLSREHPIYSDDSFSLKEFFDSIVNEYALKGTLDLYCLGEAYRLFGRLIQNGAGQEKTLTAKETHLQAAKEYIQNNYQFEIKVDDVASNVGVSANYLASVFKELEDSSTKAYLTKVRMEKAKLLLATGQYKIKEVAEMTGYKNQLHFSGEFHKYYGEAPSAFLGEKGDRK